MKVLAPGKLILTGEHAVVYGRPALVVAVNRFVECSLTPGSPGVISLDLPDTKQRASWSVQDLPDVKRSLRKRHQQFLDGILPVGDILNEPTDLLKFALALLHEASILKARVGFKLQLCSDVPIGCGMGSSAAAILSVIFAVGAYSKTVISNEQYFQWALEAEGLQHGTPSGADSYVSLHGGLQRFQHKQAEPRPMPNHKLYLAQTGRPQSTTGECVAHVAQHADDAGLWNEFEVVEKKMETALTDECLPDIQALVKRNHELLVALGVVPMRVQSFIAELEKSGVAAKICGAGALTGEQAGIVWVVSESSPLEICGEFGYNTITVKGESRGARVVQGDP